MFFNTEYVFLPILCSLFVVLSRLATWLKGFDLKHSGPILSRLRSRKIKATPKADRDGVNNIAALADYHETAACLAELIHKDGAGTWPPRANHAHSTWPAALRPYKEIYHEMAPLLPAADVSLDDEVNEQRITLFRTRFRQLLSEQVNLQEVTRLLAAADAGRWDVFPRDVYNGFYSCIAWCRHAYRWGTIPAVKVAQLETSLSLPTELTVPWASQQRHFGLASEAGNMMSNLVLNFSSDTRPAYIYRINTGLPPAVQSSEEAFARIPNEMEALALPIYGSVANAVMAHARGDGAACLAHVRAVSARLRPALKSYYDRAHDGRIKRDVWLSRVQGFYDWGFGLGGMGGEGKDKFDGLSGNQVLLFMVLDAFLGLEPYLSEQMRFENVPRLQREFCDAVARGAFRGALGTEGVEGRIREELGEIVKMLRVFRSAHRTRAKGYLMVPAPERLPMTAGKSLLKADMQQSMQFLDHFMLGRLRQTV